MSLLARLRNRLMRTHMVAEGKAAGLKLSARRADPNFARGTYELPVQNAVFANLSRGDVFYDIGANVGFFSLIAAWRVGPSGRVYAFEPVPANAAAIARSARLNHMSTIDVFTEAVGATTGRAELLLASHIGGAALASAGPPPDLSGRVDVQLVALDDAIKRRGLRPPTLVKIDVEGAEADVLEGMIGTLRAYRPKVIYEVDDATIAGLERKAGNIAEMLTAAQYSLAALPHSHSEAPWCVAHFLAQPC